MALRQSSRSLATIPQTALTVSPAAVPMDRQGAALVSERNFYKNKVRLLELDMAKLRLATDAGTDAGLSPDGLFQVRLALARGGAGAASVQRAPSVSKTDAAALANMAANQAATLQKQAANHQLAMAVAEVRFNAEKERADSLAGKLTALRKLQSSPPYRIAKRVSRWGRFWKRAGRRLMRAR